MEYWSWSYTTSTCASWWRFYFYNFYLVYVIKEHVFVSITLASKNVNVILHNTTCVTISSLRDISELLALYPSEEFRFLFSLVSVCFILFRQVRVSL